MTAQEPIKLWLRAEHKPGEARCALTPAGAAELLREGFRVTVERSQQSAFDPEDYRRAGCDLAPAGSWVDASRDTYILGLKELPEQPQTLVHRHIYFGHAFKHQQGWQGLLHRFRAGGGQLLDLEYLVDGKGRRVAAFGYWAGYCGAALAVLAWCGQQRGQYPALTALSPWQNRTALLADCRRALDSQGRERAPPATTIVGALGRVGSGAGNLLTDLDLPFVPWDLEETAAGGPFPDLLQRELLVNCVLVQSALPPFLVKDMLAPGTHPLSVIADVSCDPYSDFNPLPLYDHATTLAQPLIALGSRSAPLDLIAVDNLPALLPREASEDFCRQLLPALLQLGNDPNSYWQRTAEQFHHHSEAAGVES